MSRLEVICGPMFSGKTEELIRRLRRHQIAGKNVVAFKPAIDDRYDHTAITTHDGASFASLKVFHPFELPKLSGSYDVVGIDEAQFMGYELPKVIDVMVNRGQVVVVSGLDMTYRREPWDNFSHLLAVADKIDKLTAVCSVCGEDATLTQRLIDSQPASFEGETIIVGGKESYEARCRNCFQEG